MRVYKNTQFAEGINLPLVDFKKTFKAHLKGLSDQEVKKAHKVATDGNIPRTVRKSKETHSKKG